MSRIAWRLTDNRLLTEYIFPVNPNADSGSFNISKPLSYAATAASYRSADGVDRVSTVVYSPIEEMGRFSFNGLIYTEEQKNNLEFWIKKEYPLVLTDDLNRSFRIYSESIMFDRVNSSLSPFKHSYSWSGMVLERI